MSLNDDINEVKVLVCVVFVFAGDGLSKRSMSITGGTGLKVRIFAYLHG